MSGLIRQEAPIGLLRVGKLAALKVDVAERKIRRNIVRPARDQLQQQISGLTRAPKFPERYSGYDARVRLRVGARSGGSIEIRPQLDERFVEATLLEERLANCAAHLGVLREGMAIDTYDVPGLYFGTSTGQVFASADEGESWKEIASYLPAIASVEVAVLA